MTAPQAGQRYTAAEKEPLERAGYEFDDATDIRDSEPMYVITGYRPLHEAQPDAPSWSCDPRYW